MLTVKQASRLLLCFWCLRLVAPQLAAIVPAPRLVWNASQFVEALGDVEVEVILLDKDLVVTEADWPLSVVHITRNVTISSRGPMCLFEVGFAKERAMIAPGVQLTMERVVFSGTALGLYFYFLAASPHAMLRLRDGAFLAPVCPQASRYKDILEAHPRPEGLPGPQRGRLNRMPYCFQRKCYFNHYQLLNLAWDRPLISLAKEYLPPPSYMGLASQWTWACRMSYTISCINERGYDPCRMAAYEKLAQGKEEIVDEHYVISGAVCVGASLLALICGALYMFWSRLSRPSHQDVVPACTDIVKVVCKLGSGSFGSVYKAIWRGGREVAVKVIKYDAADSESISREIATSLRLEHPNVVHTLHYLTMPIAEGRHCELGHGSTHMSPDASKSGAMTDGQSMTWIIQELCDLGSLLNHIRPAAATTAVEGDTSRPCNNLLSEEMKLQYASDIARGMMYLHGLGICHGDLKPANVLLAHDATDSSKVVAKVADFGLSRMLEDDRSYLNTKATGTITHMAPEFLMNGKLRKSCDVYSFGCTLYELLSGEVLYPGMNVVQIIKQVSTGSRPIFPPHVTGAWISLVADCWTQEDTGRPSFQQVVARLQSMIHQHEVDLASQSSRTVEAVDVS